MAAEQKVTVRLRADVKQFTEGMRQAGKIAKDAAKNTEKSFRNTEKSTRQAGAAAAKSMRGIGTEARKTATTSEKALRGIGTTSRRSASEAANAMKRMGEIAKGAGAQAQRAANVRGGTGDLGAPWRRLAADQRAAVASSRAASAEVQAAVVAAGHVRAGGGAFTAVSAGAAAASRDASKSLSGIGLAAAAAGKHAGDGMQQGMRTVTRSARDAATQTVRAHEAAAVAAVAASRRAAQQTSGLTGQQSAKSARAAAAESQAAIRSTAAVAAAAALTSATSIRAAQQGTVRAIAETSRAGQAANAALFANRAAQARQSGAQVVQAYRDTAAQSYGVFSGMTRAEKAARREAARAAIDYAGGITTAMERASLNSQNAYSGLASSVGASFKSAAVSARDHILSIGPVNKLVYSEMAVNARAGAAATASSVQTYATAARNTYAQMRENSRQATDSSQSLTRSILGNRDAMDKLASGSAIAGAGLLAAFALPVKAFADFDAAMSGVQAATHESASNMALLREAAIKAGADTKYSGTEAAYGITELAKAGVETSDILKGGLDGALSLAAAGELRVGDAAELAATALTQFKLKGSDLNHVADLLAAGAGKAQGSVGDLGYALKQSGLVAAQTGFTIEEAIGALASFAAAGLTGSDAGTSFKVMLQKLQNPSKETAETMSELGLSLYDNQGKVKRLATFAGELKAALRGMTAEQRDATLAQIFGSDAVRAAAVLYENGQEGIQGWIDKVNDSGYAAKTAAIAQDNLKGDLEKLGGAIETLFIKSGSGVADALRPAVQWLDKMVEELTRVDAGTINTVLAIAGVTGGLLLAVAAAAKFVTIVHATRTALVELGLAGRSASAGVAASNAQMEAGAASGGKFSGVIGKLTRGFGYLALAVAGAETIALPFKNLNAQTPGVEKMTNALSESGGEMNRINDIFKNAEFTNGRGRWAMHGTEEGINGINDALKRLSNQTAFDGFNGMVNNLVGSKGSFDLLKDSVLQVDEALAKMYGENPQRATALFKQIADEAEHSGVSVSKITELFPKLGQAVTDYANKLGVALTDEEKFQAMKGELPEKLKKAGASQEELNKKIKEGTAATSEATDAIGENTKKLDENGEVVEKVESLLSDFAKAFDYLGKGFRSYNDSMGSYYESLEKLAEAFKKGKTASYEMGYGFDNASKSGRELNKLFGSVANETNKVAVAASNAGKSQEEIRAIYERGYQTIKKYGYQAGLSSEQVEDLARAAFGLQDKNISISTFMDDNARAVANRTAKEVNGIPNQVHVAGGTIGFDQATGKATQLRDALGNIPGQKNVNVQAQGIEETKSGFSEVAKWLESMPGNKEIEIDATGTFDASSAIQGVSDTVNAVPGSHNTDMTATTGNFDSAAALTAESVRNLPKSHNTDMRGDASNVNRAASQASDSVGKVPDRHNTELNVVGLGGFVGSVRRAIDWVFSIPTVRETTLRIRNITENITHKIETYRKKFFGFSGGGHVGDTMRGFASGGLISGRPPAAPHVDNRRAVVEDTGEPIRVRSGEFIMNERATRRNRPLLEFLNAGGNPRSVRGFAFGGSPAPVGFAPAPDANLRIGEQIAAALSEWKPVVEISGTKFYGVMAESRVRARR